MRRRTLGVSGRWCSATTESGRRGEGGRPPAALLTRESAEGAPATSAAAVGASMKHPQDLDLLASNSIGDDIPGVQNHELARAGHATWAAKTRLIGAMPRRPPAPGSHQPSR